MMATTRTASRLSTLVDRVRWRVRGAVESDRTRPLRFGFRELWQRDEIAKRASWAETLLREDPATVTVDPEVGYLADPFADLDVRPAVALGRELLSAAGTRVANTKGFHINQMLPRERQHELVPTALHPALVRLAMAYLGTVPILVDLDYFCSLPMPDEQPYTSSQLYHCDDTALKMIKFFIYCDDVAADDGPFELVDATRSQMVRDRVNYRYGGRAYRVGDAAMDALVPPGEQHGFLGPSGTSFVVDTARCFHRGSRIRKQNRHRMVATIQFGPPHITQLPLRLRHGAPYRHLIESTMPPLTRAILGEPIA